MIGLLRSPTPIIRDTSTLTGVVAGRTMTRCPVTPSYLGMCDAPNNRMQSLGMPLKNPSQIRPDIRFSDQENRVNRSPFQSPELTASSGHKSSKTPINQIKSGTTQFPAVTHLFPDRRSDWLNVDSSDIDSSVPKKTTGISDSLFDFPVGASKLPLVTTSVQQNQGPIKSLNPLNHPLTTPRKPLADISPIKQSGRKQFATLVQNQSESLAFVDAKSLNTFGAIDVNDLDLSIGSALSEELVNSDCSREHSPETVTQDCESLSNGSLNNQSYNTSPPRPTTIQSPDASLQFQANEDKVMNPFESMKLSDLQWVYGTHNTTHELSIVSLLVSQHESDIKQALMTSVQQLPGASTWNHFWTISEFSHHNNTYCIRVFWQLEQGQFRLKFVTDRIQSSSSPSRCTARNERPKPIDGYAVPKNPWHIPRQVNGIGKHDFSRPLVQHHDNYEEALKKALEQWSLSDQQSTPFLVINELAFWLINRDDTRVVVVDHDRKSPFPRQTKRVKKQSSLVKEMNQKQRSHHVNQPSQPTTSVTDHPSNKLVSPANPTILGWSGIKERLMAINSDPKLSVSEKFLQIRALKDQSFQGKSIDNSSVNVRALQKSFDKRLLFLMATDQLNALYAIVKKKGYSSIQYLSQKKALQQTLHQIDQLSLSPASTHIKLALKASLSSISTADDWLTQNGEKLTVPYINVPLDKKSVKRPMTGEDNRNYWSSVVESESKIMAELMAVKQEVHSPKIQKNIEAIIQAYRYNNAMMKAWLLIQPRKISLDKPIKQRNDQYTYMNKNREIKRVDKSVRLPLINEDAAYHFQFDEAILVSKPPRDEAVLVSKPPRDEAILVSKPPRLSIRGWYQKARVSVIDAVTIRPSTRRRWSEVVSGFWWTIKRPLRSCQRRLQLNRELNEPLRFRIKNKFKRFKRSMKRSQSYSSDSYSYYQASRWHRFLDTVKRPFKKDPYATRYPISYYQASRWHRFLDTVKRPFKKDPYATRHPISVKKK